jgi:hypothetical protein
MRKTVITALALTMALSVALVNDAEAARGRAKGQRGGVFQRSNGGGFFSNLMEIERRKNAWLRATFFGR